MPDDYSAEVWAALTPVDLYNKSYMQYNENSTTY